MKPIPYIEIPDQLSEEGFSKLDTYYMGNAIGDENYGILGVVGAHYVKRKNMGGEVYDLVHWHQNEDQDIDLAWADMTLHAIHKPEAWVGDICIYQEQKFEHVVGNVYRKARHMDGWMLKDSKVSYLSIPLENYSWKGGKYFQWNHGDAKVFAYPEHIAEYLINRHES